MNMNNSNKIDFKLNENNKYIKILEYKEYHLTRENISYKILIGKNENNIIISCNNYHINLKNNDFQILAKCESKTIDNAYEYIINMFENNNVFIKEIITNKMIKLFLKENETEIILVYNEVNKALIINEISKENEILKKNINDLNNKIKLLEKENNQLKLNSNKSLSLNKNLKTTNEINFNIIKDNECNSPVYIQFMEDLTTDSYSHYALDNTFLVFKSINNILNLIYATKLNSIICYNLINNIKISEIKKAHNSYITNFRHYFDKKHNVDIIMSISSDENNIKIWNFQNWDCLCNIEKINKNGSLFSAGLLYHNNQYYIITSNDNYFNSECIKVYDFDGNKISEIKGSNERTFFIEIYHDEKLYTNYIISGNNGYIKSYDYFDKNIYHKYYDKNYYNDIDDNFEAHDSVVINSNNESVKMIESSEDGNVRIWDFHSGFLISRIKVCEDKLFGICLWSNNYLFVGSDDNMIKLIYLKRNAIINNIRENYPVVTIKKIFHPKYGDCLISNNWRGQIKIWRINN